MLGCAPSFADIWSCPPGLCKSIHAWLSTLCSCLHHCTTTILHSLQALVLVIVTVAQRMLKSVTCWGHKSSEQWSLQVVIELNHSSCTCALPLAVFFVKIYAGLWWSRNKKEHWDPAKPETWIFWIMVWCSHRLSHWSSGIVADDRR